MNVADMKVDLPERTHNEWRIEKFTVSESDSSLSNLQQMNHGRGYVLPGTYTKLISVAESKSSFGGPMMTDTPDECRDSLYFLRIAKGNVLLCGLGIGLMIRPLMENERVESVTVIEIDSDIIELVSTVYIARYPERLEIIHDDARKYARAWKLHGQTFDYAWIDIWPVICADYWDEMKKLRKRFKRFCAEVEIWSYAETQRAAAESRRQEKSWGCLD